MSSLAIKCNGVEHAWAKMIGPPCHAKSFSFFNIVTRWLTNLWVSNCNPNQQKIMNHRTIKCEPRNPVDLWCLWRIHQKIEFRNWIVTLVHIFPLKNNKINTTGILFQPAGRLKTGSQCWMLSFDVFFLYDVQRVLCTSDLKLWPQGQELRQPSVDDVKWDFLKRVLEWLSTMKGSLAVRNSMPGTKRNHAGKPLHQTNDCHVKHFLWTLQHPNKALRNRLPRV